MGVANLIKMYITPMIIPTMIAAMQQLSVSVTAPTPLFSPTMPSQETDLPNSILKDHVHGLLREF